MAKRTNIEFKSSGQAMPYRRPRNLLTTKEPSVAVEAVQKTDRSAELLADIDALIEEFKG